jgi:hypothetical protein
LQAGFVRNKSKDPSRFPHSFACLLLHATGALWWLFVNVTNVLNTIPLVIALTATQNAWYCHQISLLLAYAQCNVLQSIAGGGAQRGRGGRSPYASPPPVDPDEERRKQVRTVFILLGDYSQRSDDSPSSLAENAVALVSALEEHMQVMTGGKSTSEFAELLVQAACNLGMQAPVYALMTALCAAKGKPEGDEVGLTIGRMVVDGVCAALTAALKVRLTLLC